MTMLNSNRTVLVTGITRGLGLQIAKSLLNEGYQVVGTGRKPSDELTKLLETSNRETKRLTFKTLDLANFAAIHPLVLEIKKQHGPLWGLVNNAATAHDGVLATLHQRDIEETIAVNVTGTILLTKSVLRTMLGASGGRILNISSIVAHTGYNGLSVYAASKSAMIGFTRSLAREVGKQGITVNAIAPGYMETDMSAGLNQEQLNSIRRRSPIGRLATPADVASSVIFLLSDAAEGITGTTVTVDAGTTA